MEGTESSIDKPLYSLVFPMVSVVPKGSCAEVEQAVAGSRAAEALHWLRAYGVVDGDGLDADRIAARRERGVYALPFYSAEAVYFHPAVIARVASRQSSVLGADVDALISAATTAGVAAVRDHTERLSDKAAKKAVRRAVLERIPNDDELLAGDDLQIENHAETIRAAKKRELDAAVGQIDWEAILRLCPVRESPALDHMSTALKFARRADYLAAVRHLLGEDADALGDVRALFGDLHAEILGLGPFRSAFLNPATPNGWATRNGRILPGVPCDDWGHCCLCHGSCGGGGALLGTKSVPGAPTCLCGRQCVLPIVGTGGLWESGEPGAAPMYRTHHSECRAGERHAFVLQLL